MGNSDDIGGADGADGPQEAEITIEPHPPAPAEDGGRWTGPLAAAAGSVVWPGLGHLITRSRLRGAIIASVSLVAVVAAALMVRSRRSTELVSWWVQPSWIRAAMVGCVALLAVRVGVGLDAYLRRRASTRPTRHPFVHATALLGVLAVAAAPHLAFLYYADAQLDVLTTVFVAEDTQAARPTPLPTTAAPTTGAPTTSVLDTTAPPTTAGPTSAPPTTPAPTTAPPTTEDRPTWDGDDRLTVVLLGGDGGFDRNGVRTDTIIAVSIEVATGDAVVFSIPRNWQRMQFPANTAAAELWPKGYIGIANEIYNLGARHPEAFPGADDPGGAAIKASVAQLLGTPVHYYAMVDMVGVVEAIDLFGGIDITVTEWIDDDIKPIVPGGRRLVIQTRPGDYHFDGHTALAYVRARTTSSDYHRMTRQRCVVAAMVDQVGVRAVLAHYTAFTDIIADHLLTDIPLDRLPELLEVAARLDTDRMITLNFIPPEYPRGAAPIEQVRAAAAAAFAAEADGGLLDLDDACGNDA